VTEQPAEADYCHHADNRDITDHVPDPWRIRGRTRLFVHDVGAVSRRQVARTMGQVLLNRLGNVPCHVMNIIHQFKGLIEEPFSSALRGIVGLNTNQLIASWLETDSGWCGVCESTVLRPGMHDIDVLIPIGTIRLSPFWCGLIGCRLVGRWAGQCGRLVVPSAC
jgi:hypothetical protein